MIILSLSKDSKLTMTATWRLGTLQLTASRLRFILSEPMQKTGHSRSHATTYVRCAAQYARIDSSATSQGLFSPLPWR